MTTENRELSYGEKAVGLTFNPCGSEAVNEIKKLYAEIIDKLVSFRHGAGMEDGDMEKVDLYSTAIKEAQEAQMWAVKAITWKN